MSKGMNLYLHMHQPHRVRYYGVHEITKKHDYFAFGGQPATDNKAIVEKVANKSYRPTLKMLNDLLNKNEDFKFSLSVTGTLIEQLRGHAPDVIDLIRQSLSSGRVEILGETYFHSLAFFTGIDEFESQVYAHHMLLNDVFDYSPTSFRNTELAYNNKLAEWTSKIGYKAVLAEGWDPILGWRSPNFVYNAPNSNTKLLLKNYKLSDDIAFRFSDKNWAEHPLSADKFISWAEGSLHGDVINLFMDFETFGEHQWSESGIFEFLQNMPKQWMENGNEFHTVTETAEKYPTKDTVSMPSVVTWADTERDLSAWIGNNMQKDAIVAICKLKKAVMSSGDRKLLADWRALQTSDHFYYMCTKYFNDGDVHKYFSPYETPYEAFMAYMNVVNDMKYRLGV